MPAHPNIEKINLEIRQNELRAHDWELNNLAWELYWWVDFFNILFFKNQPSPIPILTFENARITTLGHYRIGRNDFGAREQINLNRKYLHRPMWCLLSTLLHEMVHSWEYSHVERSKRTKNWYHSKVFREKIKSFGIVVNEKGCHVGLDLKGDFVHMLTRHGISFKEIPDYDAAAKDGGFVSIDPKKKPKGESKLKKWTCGCTNVRVAVRDFQATCNKCGNDFEPAN